MKRLGLAKINAFGVDTHGFFFWNFRTELESKWDYQRAVAKGWLPTETERDSKEYSKKLHDICATAPAPAPIPAPAPAPSYAESSYSPWHVLLAVAGIYVAWKVFNCFCVSSEHHGYTAITGTTHAVNNRESSHRARDDAFTSI